MNKIAHIGLWLFFTVFLCACQKKHEVSPPLKPAAATVPAPAAPLSKRTDDGYESLAVGEATKSEIATPYLNAPARDAGAPRSEPPPPSHTVDSFIRARPDGGLDPKCELYNAEIDAYQRNIYTRELGLLELKKIMDKLAYSRSGRDITKHLEVSEAYRVRELEIADMKMKAARMRDAYNACKTR